MKKLITLLSIPLIALTFNSCRNAHYDSNKNESKGMEVQYARPVNPFAYVDSISMSMDTNWKYLKTKEERDSFVRKYYPHKRMEKK
jgi:PBP1b-binding outer membrane lipoprotein LpoB